MGRNPLVWLEWLSRYGLIDIIFGLGILGYLNKLFSPKTVSSIDGLDVLPHLNYKSSLFEVEMRNNSHDTLYIYRAYFKPGYLSAKFLRERPIYSLFLQHWANDKFPAIEDTERKNVDGEYVLSPTDKNGNAMRSAFLEPGVSTYYRVQIVFNGENSSIKTLTPRKTGLLTLHLVHGTKPNILQIKL